MKNRKNVLSAISVGFIILGTISFASIPYYDGKIDQISSSREETLFNQSTANLNLHYASSNKTKAIVIRDHIDILKKLNASKPLIKEKEITALTNDANAASRAITAARATHTISEIQQNEALKRVIDLANLSKSKEIYSIYNTYSEIAGEGTTSYGESLISSTDEINKLRKKKTRFWFISIVLNSIGGVLAIISSWLKENKNNTTLSSVTTPVKNGNQV